MRIASMLMGVAVLLAAAAGASAVTFQFDPESFFDYRPVSDGFTTDGGMFKLHETWGGNMYRSWNEDQRPTLDAWKAGLGEDEGICCFNIWLANQANAPAWGETLISSGSVKPTGTAPTGWTAEVIGNPWPDGDDGYWLVQWYTTDPDLYIRPGNSVGEFSFAFGPVAATPVILGDYYTIWFGGVNYGTTADGAALVFDDSWGGFASQMVTGYGTGFEATLSLQAVPEPVTMASLALAVVGLGGYVRRRLAAR